MRDFLEMATVNLTAGVATLPSIPKKAHRIGGPGWLVPLVPELWKEVRKYKEESVPQELPELMPMNVYAHKRMWAMGMTQSWLYGRKACTLGGKCTYQLKREDVKLPHLGNIQTPMVDAMSLLYTLSEIAGYVKSIRPMHHDKDKQRHAEELQAELITWFTDVKDHPLSFNGLKTAKLEKADKYVRTLFMLKASEAKEISSQYPSHSVYDLVQEIPHDRWMCHEAYDRMVQGDAVSGPDYVPDPKNPDILGYGIVYTGAHTWKATDTQSCFCCTRSRAPIFIGLKAIGECWDLYPQTGSCEAIETISHSLTSFMHIDTSDRRTVPPTHEVAVYTRTYTSEYMRNVNEWIIDVAHFNEFTSTFC